MTPMPLVQMGECRSESREELAVCVRCVWMRVSQCGAVAAIRSQAVAEGALGPKVTEEVIGSASGDDPTIRIFRSERWTPIHSACRG